MYSIKRASFTQHIMIVFAVTTIMLISSMAILPDAGATEAEAEAIPLLSPELSENGIAPVYKVRPIGWVRKSNDRTVLEIDKEYQAALLGVDKLEEIWVLYWFDRNDNREQRSILQVHPRRNPNNPLRGVFATRAPVRPNLIALSRCRVISVQENIIEIDYIDAFPDTPILDIKP